MLTQSKVPLRRGSNGVVVSICRVTDFGLFKSDESWLEEWRSLLLTFKANPMESSLLLLFTATLLGALPMSKGSDGGES